MASPTHHIREHDVAALRERVGACPAGTVGTAVSIYEDAALVEVSDRRTGEALDLVVVPTEQLDVTWRSATRSAPGMEA